MPLRTLVAVFDRRRKTVLLLVWLASAVYVYPFRFRGWIPTDEGVFARAAERVLAGEVPHRDFPETYTGGLSYWNALSFRVLGVRLTSLRAALFVGFLAFVPAVFVIASRFGPPLWAGVVTFLAVAWSLPNYFAGSVSWYNLFFATWSTLALLRHIETGRASWLFLAGVLSGASVLFKVIGAEVLAAAFFLVLDREQDLSARESPDAARKRLSGFLVFKAAGLGLFLAALMFTVRWLPGPMEFLNFVVPAVLICGFLLWREFSEGGGRFARRFSTLVGMAWPLSAGFLLPILLFLIPFAVEGALPDLARGIVAGTGAHAGSIRMPLPPLSAVWPAVPYTIVLAAGFLAPFRLARPLLALTAAAMAAALGLSGLSEDVYRIVWYSARFLGVSVVFAACLRLRDAHRDGFWSSETRQKIFLLAAMAAMTGLVQYPYAQPIYFLYFAPLVALAIFALVQSEPRPPRLLHAGVAAFYLLFAVLRMNPAFVYALGHRSERYEASGVLDLPRAGGLRVPRKDAGVYGSLIPAVREKSGGRPIYAGPDCDQVYFLSGIPEVASYRFGSPRAPMLDPQNLLRSLEKKGSRAVVLNNAPLFESSVRRDVLERFESLFPESRVFGQFVLRWRK